MNTLKLFGVKLGELKRNTICNFNRADYQIITRTNCVTSFCGHLKLIKKQYILSTFYIFFLVYLK